MIVVQGIIFFAWTLVNAVLCGWAALMLYGLCTYWCLCPLSGFFTKPRTRVLRGGGKPQVVRRHVAPYNFLCLWLRYDFFGHRMAKVMGKVSKIWGERIIGSPTN